MNNVLHCTTLDEFIRVGDCEGGGVSDLSPFDLGLIMPSILSISSLEVVHRVERGTRMRGRIERGRRSRRTSFDLCIASVKLFRL